MNKEIEELAESICQSCKKDFSSEYCCFAKKRPCQGAIAYAETIYNAGYRKTIWHKVADGDLPKVAMHTIVYYKSKLGFTDYRTDLFWDGSFVNFGEQVIAWTELSKYEGEE